MDTYQKLAEQVTAKAEHFTELYAAMDAGDDYEDQDPHEALHESVLEIRHVLVVVLSTGGPHVECLLELDAARWLVGVTIHGYWGTERVERRVHQHEGIWRAMEEFAELSKIA